MTRTDVVYWDVERAAWCRRHTHVGEAELIEYLDGSQKRRPRAAVERDIAAGRLVPNPNADPPFDATDRRGSRSR